MILCFISVRINNGIILRIVTYRVNANARLERKRFKLIPYVENFSAGKYFYCIINFREF